MKRILLLLAIALTMESTAQNTWTQFDRLMKDGSYKSAYELAEGVYNRATASDELLVAAYHMTQAAAMYQEDVHDSAEARYRALLPRLAPLEQALCYAFLGEYDRALEHVDLLKQTPVERIEFYCEGDRTANVTPTAYDVIALRAIRYGDYTPQQRVDLQQQLVDFHAQDSDYIRIWHEEMLLDQLDRVPNRPLSLERMKAAIDKFRGSKSPYYTLFYRRVAEYYSSKEDYVSALHYCDTAIALAPKSEGGVNCANIRDEIKHERLALSAEGLWVIPGQASLQRVNTRNLDRLYYRVIPYMEDYRWGGNKTKSSLLAAKAVTAGQWSVVRGKDYHYAESYVALPALKAGQYLLLVSQSENFKSDGFMAYEVNCTDMLLVQNDQDGLLLDRSTGRPIAGQQVRVVRDRSSDKSKVMATTLTDRDGRFHFNYFESNWRDVVVIERDGYRLVAGYNYNTRQSDTTRSLQVQVRTDRPIYKPSDTLHLAVVAYRSNGKEAEAARNERLTVKLLDPNGEEVNYFTLTTDDYGVLHTRFVVPTDRIAGIYRLLVMQNDLHLCSESVRVEEYKQPKFMVTLNTDGGEAPQFGRPYTVQGLAASYSAVPVSGAKAKYTVSRRQLSPWWWRWWGYEREDRVADGEVTTAADGSFSITFTPEPDSSVELSTRPTFEYVVHVDVTDLNGESHEAQTIMRVGYRNAIVYLEEGSTPDNLKVKHIDLNGNPLEGEVSVKVELLRQPSEPRLDSPLLREKAHHTLTEAEWNKLFPLLAYSTEYNNFSHWPVAAQVEGGNRNAESGVYRITLTSDDADTVTTHLTYVAPDAHKTPSQKLLWTELDKTEAEVGETVRLRFGSRFKDVELCYLLRVGNEERDFRRIRLSDEIRCIDIPVDSSMLGGFQIDLVCVREGMEEHFRQNVVVPFSHMQLKVEIATFRDKLLPGETEEWTIRVENGKRKVESGLIMTMYDDALNSYGSGRPWGFSPWRSNGSNGLNLIRIYGWQAYWLRDNKYHSYTGSRLSAWELKEALPYYSYWRGRRMYRTAMAKNSSARGEEEVEEAFVQYDAAPVIEIGSAQSGSRLTSDDIARMPGNSVESIVAAVGGIGFSDGGRQQEVQVRSNLNTLAFFAPTLRTDSTGTATYRFTVPELLTRWNIKGLAITKDIKTGTLDRTLVTSKPLMVQPNIPRFLRTGDSMKLMAKVVLNDPKDLKDPKDVTVTFLLTDAATGDTLCSQHKHLAVKDAAQVLFDLKVPQDVYVATYKIVATADGMSDGEQGQVPVVTNRQAVTLSQALYINGAGEKHFSMPEWLAASDSRQPRLVGAEVVSTPVWLAVKCMPYLKTYENPSSLYLANQLYVNGLGQEILKDFKNLKDLKDFNETSRLKMNEDVKQTLLKATPWLQDAQSEQEQMAAVANYFKAGRIESELCKASNELQCRQNLDGGWSWMPDGPSSLWITQQVLKKIKVENGKWKEESVRALDYIDREHQRNYEKFIKPYLKKKTACAATDIDYLYTRSFYGKGTTEAYAYYYSNALKNYRDYENLYTQAQLALVFHRHGDRKAALDLLRRLKEKSLQSDEMGLYWRDNRSGWFWYQRPIETQALLIQAFAEITPDDSQTIGQMQQWLLKQKQTTHWGNDAATTDAIKALMVGRMSEAGSRNMDNTVELTVFGSPLTSDLQPPTSLEGYRTQRWTGAALDTLRSFGNSDIVVRKYDDGIAWGSVYYQFTDDMDRIPSSDMGIKISRRYEVGSQTSELRPPTSLKVGDKIKVRIDIQCDRAMEYLELIDGRPSCVEPLSTRAGWRWNDGLSYYIVVNNTDTRCYIDRLEKGKYWFEYEVYVTNPGQFLTGPVTMQCMYAPEFRATAPAETLTVLP